MGNEESSPIDESIPPATLAGRTGEAVAEYIKSGMVKNIVVMSGAGISTSAGIPDFRSPDTGLYANLAKLDLPYAEAVFDINYFRKNPKPFYTLAHELYPGKYRPTITHSFIRLLNDKGLLLKHFTQNIDCLDREAGVPDDKIVEAHGSFARQSCIDCSMPYPEEYIQLHIEEQTIPRCELCKGLVKPEIVFFGEQLPAAFFQNRMLPHEADLCIILGTSLTVQPFASLPTMTREETPRVLINKERVGGIGSRADDVLLLGDCDEGVRRLATACGWIDELEALWQKTAPKDAPAKEAEAEKPEKTKDEALDDEIDKLTKEVDKTLNVSKWHENKISKEVVEADNLSRWLDKKAGYGRRPESPSSWSTESAAVSKHEDKDGNLGHIFVSGGEGESSKTPVVQNKDVKESESRGGDSKVADGKTGDESTDSKDSKG